MAAPTNDRLIRLNDVLHITGLSRSTLYRKIDEGTFPKQIRIAARCTAWRESDVIAWVGDPRPSPRPHEPGT
nr:AlpA family transcriptional regulator [Novosphingobium panipatense]